MTADESRTDRGDGSDEEGLISRLRTRIIRRLYGDQVGAWRCTFQRSTETFVLERITEASDRPLEEFSKDSSSLRLWGHRLGSSDESARVVTRASFASASLQRHSDARWVNQRLFPGWQQVVEAGPIGPDAVWQTIEGPLFAHGDELRQPVAASSSDGERPHPGPGRGFHGVRVDRGTDWSDVDLTGADLSDTHLHTVRLVRAELAGAHLCRALTWGSDFTFANLTGANLCGGHLEQTDFSCAVMIGARLAGASLSDATLTDADLRGADLCHWDHHDFGNPREGLPLSPAPGGVGGADQASGPAVVPAVLRGANLDGACLAGARLAGVDFTGASLVGADLTGALLHGATLTDADLHDADLTAAKLWFVDARRANFTNAVMTGSIPTGGDFTGADFTGADFGEDGWEYTFIS